MEPVKMTAWEKFKLKARSPVVWAATATAVFAIIHAWTSGDLTFWESAVQSLIALVFEFAALNNPDSRSEF